MFWYLVGVNFFAFLLYGLDKHLAIKGRYRISEYTLLAISFFGGSIGSLLGMKIFHHKTRKLLFWFLNGFFLFLWLVIYLEIHNNILHM